jgi:hypothetical protein
MYSSRWLHLTRDCVGPGMPKTAFKAWVRRLGTLCAVLQLGTAFAASRALFVSEVRQRLVAMDLRCWLKNLRFHI